MQMCLESAQNIISILSSLQGQGLLGKNNPSITGCVEGFYTAFWGLEADFEKAE
jgi:hypothetical protein